MEKINSEMIELGMKFSEPVYFDDGQNMFLPEKKPVRKFHLDTLKRWNIPYVVTDGRLMANTAIDLDELLGGGVSTAENDNIDSSILFPETDGDDFSGISDLPVEDKSSGVLVGKLEDNPVYTQYNEYVTQMHSIFINLKENDTDTVTQNVLSVTDGLIKLMERNDSLVASFLLAGKVKQHDYARSAVNTAIITNLVARRQKLSTKKIRMYMTGALIHDIGMLSLPESLINKKDALLPEEFSKLKMHTKEGACIAGEVLHFPTEVTDIVLQHHEHWDGLGYPYALKKEEISAGAAIVAVADAFEAMITEKSYRTSMLGYEAMKTLLSDNCRHFSPDVLKAFIQSMGVYPIGSIVLLNDSSIARITEGNTEAPFRPTVRLLVSSDGVCYQNNSGSEIKLENFRKLFIVRALDSKDLHGKFD